MQLVLDSSAAVRACRSHPAAERLVRHSLIAPPLLWSEFHSAVHEAAWRGEIDNKTAESIRAEFARLGVVRRSPGQLYAEAYRIATELGWAKTYDAEFLALARIAGAKVLTTDGRLHRGAARTGLVITPAEL